RDRNVTGVQTCALPISKRGAAIATGSYKIAAAGNRVVVAWNGIAHQFQFSPGEDGIFVRTSSDGGATFGDVVKPVVNVDSPSNRSEERRVGKECERWRV